MSDSVTPNLGLTIPAHGEAGTWEAEIDNDFVLIDTAIGENAAAISAEASARIATNASLSAAITAETSRAEAAEASCEKTANKSVANGYPSLDGSGKVPIAQIPQIPYSDLTGTPTLGTAAAQPTTAFDAAGSAATVQTNLAAEISRATAAEALKANTSSLATVATSGSYADLTNKPSLGTAAAQSTSAFDAAGTATTAAAGVQTNLTTEVTRATTAEGLLVAKTTTVNGHALSGNVVVSASDLTTGTLPHAQLPALIAADIPALSYDASGAAATVQTNLAAEVSRATAAEGLLVPKATTVNGHALSANVTVSASDLTTGTLAVAQLPTIPYSQLSGTPAIPVASSTAPNMDGTATIGTLTTFAKADHVHPTDTSRVATTTTVNGHALSSNVVVSASDLTTGTLPVGQLPTIPYSQLSGTPAIPSVPITTIQNNGVAVAPVSGVINLVPGANITLTTSGDAVTVAAATTASLAFSGITGGTNTTAAMVVGSGSSLAASGTGTITATAASYSGLTGTIPTWNQNTTGTASNLSGTPALPNGATATTQTQADGSTKLATTLYVDTGLATKAATSAIPVVGTATPLIDGAATIGATGKWADSGHIHPTDTSRQAALGYTPVANTVTVNGHALSANVTVSASDITTGTLPHAQLPALMSGDIPANAANTSGSAASFTGTLVGDVTGTQGATVVGKINGTSLAGLATGILKNTTTTGVPTIAVAGTDYALPNANTSGTAANLSGTPALPNGTTASTQPQADGSMKLATTAYVDTGLATKQASLGYTPVANTVTVNGHISYSLADIVDGVKGFKQRKYRDLCNAVRAKYICPSYPYSVVGYDKNHKDGQIFDGQYQPTDAPQYAQDALHGYGSDANLAADGGIRLIQDRSYSFVQSVGQCQRLMKIYMLRNRFKWTGTIRVNAKGLQNAPNDVITLNIPEFGFNNHLFEIIDLRHVPVFEEGKPPMMYWEFDLAETDPSIYTWSVAEEMTMTNSVSPALGSSLIVAPVTGLTLSSTIADAVVSVDGIVTPRINVTWTQPADAFVTSGGSIVVEYQAVGASTWQLAAICSGTATQLYIDHVIAGQQYLVQTIACHASGASSTTVGAGPIVVGNNVSNIASPTVLNPNFELGDTGWSKQGGWTISQAGQSYSGGSWTGNCWAGSGTSAIVNNAITSCTPGQVWSAQCMALPTPWPGSAGLDGILDARVCFVNAAGAVVSYKDGNMLTSSNTSTNNWFLSKSTYTAPAGAVGVYMDIACYSHTVGTWMVDACQLYYDGDGTSTALNNQGSIIPNQSVVYSTTYSNSTCGVSVASQSLLRADGSTFTVNASSLSYTGLASSTTYYIYPYISVATGNIAAANGTPPPTTANSIMAIQAAADGRIPLTPVTITTSASSGGSGGGYGGGGCPESAELVDVQGKGLVAVGTVQPGDYVLGKSLKSGEDVYRKVVQVRTETCHAWRMIDGHKNSPCESVYYNNQWLPAFRVPSATFNGDKGAKVLLAVEADDYGEHNFYLASGAKQLIHNEPIMS